MLAKKNQNGTEIVGALNCQVADSEAAQEKQQRPESGSATRYQIEIRE